MINTKWFYIGASPEDLVNNIVIVIVRVRWNSNAHNFHRIDGIAESSQRVLLKINSDPHVQIVAIELSKYVCRTYLIRFVDRSLLVNVCYEIFHSLVAHSSHLC